MPEVVHCGRLRPRLRLRLRLRVRVRVCQAPNDGAKSGAKFASSVTMTKTFVTKSTCRGRNVLLLLLHVRLATCLLCFASAAPDNATAAAAAADGGCPVGSKLDVGVGRCLRICSRRSNDATNDNDNDNDNETAAAASDCQTSAKNLYKHLADDVHQEQMVAVAVAAAAANYELPACKNITLRKEEFAVSEDGSSVSANVGNVMVTTDEFRLSDGNASAEVCYPLSPQLLQCRLRKLRRQEYDVLPTGRTLLDRTTNVTIGIRDYYPIPETDDGGGDGGDVLVCNGTVNIKRKLRCNYITYTPAEYRFVEDGRRLILLPTNTSIYRPTYTDIGNGTLYVCYPSSLAFTCCELWTLETNEFRIRPDHRLEDIAHGTVYDISDYLIINGLGAVCLVPATNAETALDIYYVHACLYVVSAVCLCVAFVVHLIVPSLNFHAKPLLCHMICMTIMYTALAVRKFARQVDEGVCYALFVATYYSAMASFFWLNVLAFDLWTIFANLQTTSSGGRLSCSCKINVKRSFYYYGVYALGVPALFCAAAIAVDQSAAMQRQFGVYPRIAAMCWFNERKAAYAFLYVPMIAVLVANLAMFVSTVRNLRQASRGVEVVNKKRNKQLLIVCFKLFVIMGFCWIGEAIAWTADAGVAAFYVPDAINAVQGIVIFLIYICKPQTYRLLRKRFCSTRNSDGRWTSEFNTSSGYSQRTTTGSINDRDQSIKSNKRGPDDRPVGNSSTDKNAFNLNKSNTNLPNESESTTTSAYTTTTSTTVEANDNRLPTTSV